jgi:hypothetical protein
MRRTFLTTRPSRAVYRAFGSQQARRTFATPPIKDDSPPSPIVPSKEQAHPVGPFYEAILRTPKPLPKEKPEEPPVTSQESRAQTPKPAPAEQQSSKPAAEQKPAQPAAEDKAAAKPAAAEEDKKPAARRPRKPKQSAAAATKDESATKAKSVPSSSFTPSTPSSPGPAPPPPEEAEEEASPRVETESSPSNNDLPQTRGSVVTFAPSLAGPAERAERLARLRRESRLVAGVLVPPKPEEPDNCCMSGCVNCVWDRYRDEMEEWAGLSAEAERRLKAMEAGGQVGATEECIEGVEHGRGMQLGVHEEVLERMDQDGSGSGFGAYLPEGSGRIAKDFWDEELYKNVPVGIREFMKQEKRLKEKHLREGTVGG